MTEEELQNYLSRSAGRPVTLRMNTNSSSIVNVWNGKRRGELKASVHRIFLDAPPEVLSALAGFMRSPAAQDRAIVRGFIAERHRDSRKCLERRRRLPVQTVGEWYDLEPVARAVNNECYGGRLDYSITWSRRPSNRPRRLLNVTLGLCQQAERRIRIHPILDSSEVPRFFLEYVIHHEMAHLAVPARVCPRTARHYHHTPEFYAVEKSFPRYREAILWQEENLDRLIKAWCSGAKRPGRRLKALQAIQLRLF